jgi:uncharacterized protein (DUF983 family)
VTAGIAADLTAVAIIALAIVGLALWRSARSGSGIWWPLVVAALVCGGLCLAILQLGGR